MYIHPRRSSVSETVPRSDIMEAMYRSNIADGGLRRDHFHLPNCLVQPLSSCYGKQHQNYIVTLAPARLLHGPDVASDAYIRCIKGAVLGWDGVPWEKKQWQGPCVGRCVTGVTQIMAGFV